MSRKRMLPLSSVAHLGEAGGGISLFGGGVEQSKGSRQTLAEGGGGSAYSFFAQQSGCML